MQILQIVFSPAGGTQRVADLLTQAWQTPVKKTDLTDAETDWSAFCPKGSDVAVIAVPSYGGRVPAVAARRIARLHGGGVPCVLVCVYGNRAYEDTLAELSDLAQASGFCVIAAVAAVAEHSILPQYAAGRPDAQDAQELHRFGQKILQKVNDGNTAVPQIPGNRPYKAAGTARLVPKTTDRCSRCGRCAARCPVQAILKSDPAKTDGDKCITCMRCVKECPQSARQIDRSTADGLAQKIKSACTVPKHNELFM